MISELSPIIIFTYRRIPNKLISGLLNNSLAQHSDVIVYSDGNKDDADLLEVKAVREYLTTISGFGTIKIIESEVNKGLANSIIDGVSQVIDKFGKAIVLEDDLIVSNDLLEYMNNALDFYQNNRSIWSISGYGPNMPCLRNYDADLYLSIRGSSWGWATWQNRWNTIDWDIKGFNKLQQDKNMQNKFNLGGNDMFKMLELQMLGKIDSWAIRWCYSQFTQDTYTVYPTRSKVINDGFNDNKGIHNSNKSNQLVFEVNNTKINFKDLELDDKIVQCFEGFHNLSIKTKIGYLLKKHGGYDLTKKLFHLYGKDNNMLEKIKKIKRVIEGKDFFYAPSIQKNSRKIGSEYGGWWISTDEINNRPLTIFSFGLGEDISFDIDMMKQYKCTLHGFDPTPKSIKYIESLNLDQNFHFYKYALSDKNGTLSFNLPVNDDHISGSLEEISSSNTIQVKCKNLQSICKELNIKDIDILKMDIEGSEYKVLENMIDSNIYPDQVLVEYHHFFKSISNDQTKKSIDLLLNNKYELFKIEGYNYSFIRNNKLK